MTIKGPDCPWEKPFLWSDCFPEFLRKRYFILLSEMSSGFILKSYQRKPQLICAPNVNHASCTMLCFRSKALQNQKGQEEEIDFREQTNWLWTRSGATPILHDVRQFYMMSDRMFCHILNLSHHA